VKILGIGLDIRASTVAGQAFTKKNDGLISEADRIGGNCRDWVVRQKGLETK